MGHSSLQVSLTYLCGLEVTELKEEDKPLVNLLLLKIYLFRQKNKILFLIYHQL